MIQFVFSFNKNPNENHYDVFVNLITKNVFQNYLKY